MEFGAGRSASWYTGVGIGLLPHPWLADSVAFLWREGGQSPPKIINRVCSYLMVLLSGNWRNSKAGRGFAVRQGSLVLHSVNKGPGVVVAHWTFCRKEWTLKVTELTGQGVIITQTGLICLALGIVEWLEVRNKPYITYSWGLWIAHQQYQHYQHGSLSEMQMKEHCTANQNSNGQDLKIS